MAYKLSITPGIERLTEVCLLNSRINSDLYKELDIKRGLRDINGAGGQDLPRYQPSTLLRWLTALKLPVKASCITVV